MYYWENKFASKDDENYNSIPLIYILLKQWTTTFNLSNPPTGNIHDIIQELPTEL